MSTQETEGEAPTFRPRNDVVIVRRIKIEWKGVARPETAKTRYELYSLVIAVGPKVEDLKAGDRIIGLFSGAVPLHNTLPIYAMSEDVVLAKVEGGIGIEATKPPKQSLVIPAKGPLPPPIAGRRPGRRGKAKAL